MPPSLTPSSTIVPSATPARTACRVRFGGLSAHVAPDDSGVLHVALPVLAGAADEVLLESASPPETHHGFQIFRADEHRIAGFALAPAALELEAAAAELYRRLFALTAGLHLHRIWNYVPEINAQPDGLENYRRFCRGRSLAFERQFGREFEQRMPAASGVGAQSGPLALAFLAGREAPRHFENPQQVPAFHYPAAYGPRAPSFSRATLVQQRTGGRQLFISGTAAIRGHATVAPGDLSRQLDCTVENLRLIGATAGAGDDLGRSGDWRRSFKIYLRHAGDLPPVQTHLARHLLRAGAEVSYLHADICRAELGVEIEAVLSN